MLLHRRARALLSFALLAAVFTTPVARAQTDVHKDRALAAVAAARSAAASKGSFSSFVVIRDGRSVITPNARAPMTPASLLKLATTTTAIARFGPDATFATRAVTTAAPDLNGVVPGLTLIGGGDPTFVTKAYATKFLTRKPGMPDGTTIYSTKLPTVELLASRLARAGVKQINGDLLVDDFNFDGSRVQKGWLSSYLNHSRGGPDTGYIDGLTVDEGYADVRRVSLTPSPALRAGALLRAALRVRGITVTGDVRKARAPSGAVEIARVTSPALHEIVAYICRWSENYAAEILLKDLGVAFGARGSTVEGVKGVRAFLAERGVDLADLAMYDGSGLSLDDRIRPRALAKLITIAVYDRSVLGWNMRPAYPVALEPGTLYRRTGLTPVKHNLTGKTGNVRHVRGMAGWVRARDGALIVYVALFNNASDPMALTSVLDRFGIAMARL